MQPLVAETSIRWHVGWCASQLRWPRGHVWRRQILLLLLHAALALFHFITTTTTPTFIIVISFTANIISTAIIVIKVSAFLWRCFRMTILSTITNTR